MLDEVASNPRMHGIYQHYIQKFRFRNLDSEMLYKCTIIRSSKSKNNRMYCSSGLTPPTLIARDDTLRLLQQFVETFPFQIATTQPLFGLHFDHFPFVSLVRKLHLQACQCQYRRPDIFRLKWNNCLQTMIQNHLLNQFCINPLTPIGSPVNPRELTYEPTRFRLVAGASRLACTQQTQSDTL